jgi:ABC-type phosphate transport system substrate-binding protein
MKKNLRGTVTVAIAALSFLAVALPAGAVSTHKTFTIDAIMKNDLNLKTSPGSTLTMGGSSFDGPLVQAAESTWESDIHKSPFSAYAVTKSGTGRSGAITGSYNIGFSDFPMNQGGDCDLGGSPVQPAGSTCSSYTSAHGTLSQYVQVPVVLGGVGIIFHFGTGISGSTASILRAHPLTFSGKVLGEIFAGKITNWDSPLLLAANPHLKSGTKSLLPNLAIVVESRTSGSGTTFGFKDYLSRVDATDFPVANSAAFTAAAATNANSGALAEAVSTTNGAIGYVEYGYAVANTLPTANLVNASGKTVALSEAGILESATVGLKSITASSNKTCKALGGFSTANLKCFSIENQVGATVYPIALFSYAMVPKVQTNLTDAIAIVKFLDYLSHQGGGTKESNTFGQDLADGNGYVPMPVAMQTIARTLILEVTVSGHTVLSATN